MPNCRTMNNLLSIESFVCVLAWRASSRSRQLRYMWNNQTCISDTSTQENYESQVCLWNWLIVKFDWHKLWFYFHFPDDKTIFYSMGKYQLTANLRWKMGFMYCAWLVNVMRLDNVCFPAYFCSRNLLVITKPCVRSMCRWAFRAKLCLAAYLPACPLSCIVIYASVHESTLGRASVKCKQNLCTYCITWFVCITSHNLQLHLSWLMSYQVLWKSRYETLVFVSSLLWFLFL